MSISEAGEIKEVALGSVVVAITAASVEQTGLLPGRFYRMSACGGAAICRWDTSAATIADGGATFCINRNETRIVYNPPGNSLLNVIESDASSDGGAILFMALVNQE